MSLMTKSLNAGKCAARDFDAKCITPPARFLELSQTPASLPEPVSR